MSVSGCATTGPLFLCIWWRRRPLESLGGGVGQGKAAQEDQVAYLIGTVDDFRRDIGTVFKQSELQQETKIGGL